MSRKRPSVSHECHPTHCDTCTTRDQSPLCSVDDARNEVIRARTSSHFKAHQTIFYQGNDPLGLYVIQSGLVKLESVSADGSSNTLRLLGPGQALGYRALFAGEKYQASAIAVEDGVCCFIAKSTLLDIVRRHPEVAINLLQQFSKDLRTAEEKWITQVNKGAPERVAEALLFLDEHFHNQAWTRKEIAEWAGTTPETVMRTLSQFEKEGLISAEGRAYKILSPSNLDKKSQGT